MSAATVEKTAARRRAAAAPMTLAQATDVAITELSKAIDLMVSAQRASEDGHHLDRALRVAEEIALDVMGWMDHGQRSPGEWMDRMFDCQAVLRCASLDPSELASTLAASQAAEAVDRATAVLDQPLAGVAPRAAATVAEQQPLAAALPAERRILAFDAYHQITGLADGLQKILNEHGATTGCTDEAQLHLGIVARINLLADVIFHAARLDGTDGSGWGDWDDLVKLRRVFEGRMP
ncbi:MAG: hypothetical protein DI587_31290 [Variovorax paradoxus]|nr:MAG: hypothetical protein DI583_31290 [Variovorax paradoxus]PZQ03146.1 MAG: hypothetical protein DI587_31290 [Variovorax paradoxus]